MPSNEEAPTTETVESSGRSYSDVASAFNQAVDNVDRAAKDLDTALGSPEKYTDEEIKNLREELAAADNQAKRLNEELNTREIRDRSRASYSKLDIRSKSVKVNEPDIYAKGGRPFLTDLYMAQVKYEPQAMSRIAKHNQFELDKRPEEFAMTSSSVGGIIPPAYLLELYGKASRNGRVYADAVNNSGLPDVGMNIILPRITTASAAGIQATENSAVSTQDVAETDLTVPVRTIGGFLAVSRQAIERAAYSDQILFEDLIARYWAALDTQCISGTGSAGQILGVLNTSSISTSTAGTATVAGVWPKIADVLQQVNVAVGGLGYTPDKIVMHPRRWGFFEAALDTQNRPLFGIGGQPAFNVIGGGNPDGYGLVGYMHGLPVYTDANIPTNLGAATNEDRIIVMASRVVHLFERAADPVTLSFEQQAGTSLQVQLIVYGYAAFTAGRYPAASGVVSGAGLVPPTF